MTDQQAIDLYLNHYKMLCPEIEVDILNYIKEDLQVVRLKPKDFYLKSGEMQHSLAFLVHGLVRAYYEDLEGNEKTAWFSYENEYVTDYPNYISRKPSKFQFQCIESCIMVELPYESMQDGYNKYKIIERYGRLVTEYAVVGLQYRIDGFLFKTAEERYLDFITQNPKLFNRISLTDLASYLGVERQSLSRIRSRLSKSKLPSNG
ncbi:MAG: Crp/Fnr family transcriptional regulator [Cytophagaceae bacterium]|nr:Crp/Fnr family transcriptional regulator [Cytophagaceae bacterium]MBL0303826.1 Crp/Fnr family transcriptional regulator [Cytophagaceae bacterium]MBL0326642.1 Crp/Fnr family transcriptional regulator [Cytophagaceae bacterium]